MSNYKADKFSDEEFETWRYKMDDRADAVAKVLIDSHHHYHIYRALSKINTLEDPIDIRIFHNPPKPGEEPKIHSEEDLAEHSKLAAILNDYFNDLSLMPTPEEQEVIIKGSLIFNDSPSECIIALAVRSLLKQYAAYKATNVLVATQLLTGYPHRRILETMQFVIDVMDINGFKPTGRAVRSIQKLRLVHALIRARILAKQKDPGRNDLSISMIWKDEWGLPINQQDMIFAVHTFSVEVLDGLIAAKEKVSDETIESYYLAWHYIGRALGVLDPINPTAYSQGKALQERIYSKQFVKDNPNGPALAKPLMKFMEEVLPFHPSDRDILAIVKIYNDEKDYEPVFKEILGLDLNKSSIVFGWLMRTIDSFWHTLIKLLHRIFPLKKDEFDKMLAMKSHSMIQRIVQMKITWTSTAFQVADGFGQEAARDDEEKKRDLKSKR